VNQKLMFLVFVLLFSVNENNTANENLLFEILQATDQRLPQAKVFDRALAGNVQQNQRQALLALGRIGDSSARLKIAPFLYSKQPEIRAMAAFALGISNDTKAHQLLQMVLKSEHNPVVIARLLIAIGNLGEQSAAIASILPFLNHQDEHIVAAACDALTLAWTFHRDRVSVPNSTQVHRLLQLANKNQLLAHHCLFTLTRLRHDTALFDKQQLSQVASTLTSVSSKILVLRIMGAQKDRVFQQQFISAARAENPVSIRAEAAAAISALDYQEPLLPIYTNLANDSSPHVKVNFIDNLTLSADNKPLLKLLEKLHEDPSPWVRSRAIVALFAVKGSEMGQLFSELLAADDFMSQQIALDILQQYQLPNEQNYVEKLAQSKHKGIRNVATELLKPDNDETDTSTTPNKTINPQQALSIAGKQLKIMTSKGPITIQLMASAVYTSNNFYQLAITGFYNDLIFHRVIPNFVAQGGDPEGTGRGGPGYSIREELYPVGHTKGTVGMASSGKDTAGAQFFFNTADNIHLNSNYTVFARVTVGIEIVENLEFGDRISITELP